MYIYILLYVIYIYIYTRFPFRHMCSFADMLKVPDSGQLVPKICALTGTFHGFGPQM